MGKLARFSPWPIVVFHNKALRGTDDVRFNMPEKVLVYVVPVLALIAFSAFRLRLAGVPQLLAASSLLVGAMLSTFVFLANLRVKISESDAYKMRSNLKELVGSAAVGALYVSFVAMVLAMCLAIVSSWPWLSIECRWQTGFTSGVCAGLLIHLMVSFSSVLRKLLNIYKELFAEDFMAKPNPD